MKGDVMKITTQQAVKALQKALKKDDGYRETWEANIAMAFYDEYRRNPKRYKNRGDQLEIARNAAGNFLDMLIKQ